MALKYNDARLKTAAAASKLALAVLMATSLLTGAGCGRRKVEVYQIRANQDQTEQTASAAAASENPQSGGPNATVMENSSSQMPTGVVPSDAQNAPPITWTTPPGWASVPPSEMRVASFKVAGPRGQAADVSIVPLPGMAGGDFANVNRWRGQVGLAAAPDNELQNAAQTVEAGGAPASVYDLVGRAPSTGHPTRILGAIQHRDGTTWFVKMIGDADLVEQQKPAFIALVQSLNFGAQTAQAQLPPGHPDISQIATVSAGETPSNEPNWTVPVDWQAVPGGPFLVAKFKIKGKDGQAAEINVSSSAGDGGGLAANVNRWRGQLGLAPEKEISTMDFQVPGGEAQFVDLAGKDAENGKASEIVGVMVMLPGQTWFYKLMGAPAVVAAQKDAFAQFVKGAQY